MRRPGLIRWNFFGYLGFAVALTLAYIFFGLDGHVKNLVQQKLSALHGADVHISKAAFRFNGPRIELDRLEFHDPSRVGRVQFTVDRVQLDLEWAALLRNRLVVTDSSATGVHLNSLQPPEPAVNEGQSLIPKQSSQTLAYASDFLSNPTRTELPAEEAWAAVPSVQAKNGLSSEFQNEVSGWKKALDALIQENHEQTEAIRNTVNQASEKDADAHVKIMIGQLEKSRLELEQLETQVKAEGNTLLAKIQTLVELQPHDVTVIRQNVKLPNLEFKNIEAEVGAPELRPALSFVDHFYFKLLPWLEKKEQVLQSSYGRDQGTEFFFTGRYLPPRLWVKKLEISSKETPDGSLGDVSGRVTDLSSEPNHYAAQLSLQASFKKAEVSNLQLESQIDHRNNQVDDRLQLNIASYPVRDLDFVKTPSLRMGIAQADANLNLEYLAQKDAVIINVSSTLDKVMYRVDTESEALKKVFDESLAPLTSVKMDANAQGKLPAPHWNFTSNLSDRLKTSLQQVLGQEYDEFNGRIKERAYQRVVEARKSLETSLVTESEAIQLRIAEEKEKLKGLTAEYKASKKIN
ncbi:MAG: TIGR03545 family protein [Proteobacteria bacterium]|nr:MAG: TIGR03545 family protein [Pseudomonadota bacterium]